MSKYFKFDFASSTTTGPELVNIPIMMTKLNGGGDKVIYPLDETKESYDEIRERFCFFVFWWKIPTKAVVTSIPTNFRKVKKVIGVRKGVFHQDILVEYIPYMIDYFCYILLEDS